MSQQIRVLQCIECSLYQVDIAKKSHRWQCKVCRQKQVVQQEFFRGTGAECRSKVQQLNLERGEKQQAQEQRRIEEVQAAEEDCILIAEEAQLPKRTTSKWAAFVEESQGKQASRTDLAEAELTAATRIARTSNKRSAAAATATVAAKKPFSKWQKFL